MGSAIGRWSRQTPLLMKHLGTVQREVLTWRAAEGSPTKIDNTPKWAIDI